jgi:hypothetical protein
MDQSFVDVFTVSCRVWSLKQKDVRSQCAVFGLKNI